jgi:multiple sugar transport system ATP-binding protein
LNVYDNIAFGLRLKRLKKDEIDCRVWEVAGILGIEQLLKRNPRGCGQLRSWLPLLAHIR